ncbi:MAG TPA: hypothetical protein VM238_18900 [Phycisphaerae bacterium]|nr:hypothetical protein [Phycisphaerae bacterium]
MTARTVKTAGEGERNGEGLRGSPMPAARQGILADIMTRKRPDAPVNRSRAMLADPRSGDKIVRKADGGRRREAIQEIPVE